MLTMLKMMKPKIHLKDKNMREEVQKAITNSKETKVLNLQGMQITAIEIADIINSAKQTQPNLKVINLKNNKLGDDGAIALYESTHDCHHLEQLNVEFNGLSQAGILAIAKLKLEHQDLQLFFHGNQVTDVGQMDDIYRILRTLR